MAFVASEKKDWFYFPQSVTNLNIYECPNIAIRVYHIQRVRFVNCLEMVLAIYFIVSMSSLSLSSPESKLGNNAVIPISPNLRIVSRIAHLNLKLVLRQIVFIFRITPSHLLNTDVPYNSIDLIFQG